MEFTSVAVAVISMLIGIRASYELSKRAKSMTLCVVSLAFIGFLFVPSASAGASPQQTMGLTDGHDNWYYDGEVSRDSGKRGECHYPHCPYCSNGFCAHGVGDLSHDGSWDYVGSFADGVFHGEGTFNGDHYSYVGGFEHGEFHGYGVLLCCGKLEGKFTHGRFPGRPGNWPKSCSNCMY